MLTSSCGEGKKKAIDCNTEQWAIFEPPKTAFTLKLPHTLKVFEYNSSLSEKQTEIYSRILNDTVRGEGAFLLVDDFSDRKDKEDSTTIKLRIQALSYKNEIVLFSHSYNENGWEIFIKKSETIIPQYHCSGYIACTRNNIVMMCSFQTSNKNREAANHIVDCFINTFNFR